MRLPHNTMKLPGVRPEWIIAVLITLGLNLLLFGALPYLMQPAVNHLPYEKPVIGVNLIRMKPLITPPPKKEVLEPETRQPITPVKPAMNQIPKPNLSLPFEINTRLLAGPTTLTLPAITLGNLDTLDQLNLVGVEDLDQPLTILARMQPVYPMNAKKRGIEGWVKVQFIVTEKGGVDDIRIISSKPEKIFDVSVIQCVAAWRFKPGTVGNIPVRTRAETTIRFELE